MTIKLSPQSLIVLRHLRKTRSITNVEANAVHGVRSVSRRITEIIRAGFLIEKDFRKDVNGQRYVRYSVCEPGCDICNTLFKNVEGL